MLDALAQRTIIVGNSGSGKSTLAARIAAATGVPHIGLDEIYWIDQSFLRKRGQAEALQMMRAAGRTPGWVIEGVFGWLVDVVSPCATTLVWLDLPWDACEAGLLERGPVWGSDEAEFNQLLVWAHLYWERQTSSSHAGHEKIFDDFAGRKLRLQSREDVEAFVGAFTRVLAAGELAAGELGVRVLGVRSVA
ncbi:MAG: hypothetical protein ABL901_18255 [Hyphomicrobiaceae bacterium]